MRAASAKWFWRTVRWSIAFVTVLVTVNGVFGYVIYTNAAESVLSQVDAIVVLGGEHDGREEYALQLAGRGLAPAVLLSNPYPATDRLMTDICGRHYPAVQVICARPDPLTTRGESVMTRQFATQRHWNSILVVTWRYHLPRARTIFAQCLSGMRVSVSTKAVPRTYVLPEWYWQYIYLYQTAGYLKAETVDRC